MIKEKIILFCFISAVLAANVPAALADSDKPMDKTEIMNLMSSNERPPSFERKEWGPRSPFGFEQESAPTAQPPVTEAKSSGDYVLQGLFLGSSKPSAIINGAVVGIGDTVKDAVVKEISEGQVTLRDQNGQEIILSLKKT